MLGRCRRCSCWLEVIHVLSILLLAIVASVEEAVVRREQSAVVEMLLVTLGIRLAGWAVFILHSRGDPWVTGVFFGGGNKGGALLERGAILLIRDVEQKRIEISHLTQVAEFIFEALRVAKVFFGLLKVTHVQVDSAEQNVRFDPREFVVGRRRGVERFVGELFRLVVIVERQRAGTELLIGERSFVVRRGAGEHLLEQLGSLGELVRSHQTTSDVVRRSVKAALLFQRSESLIGLPVVL